MTFSDEIKRAAALIREGKLVAFPTETVYGLGANALDADAVAAIFSAKGRPSTSPLIIHVDSIEMARRYVIDWPAAADRLARGYWPGPLTIVLPKDASIPDIATAGLPTAGIRVPAHPLALDLIRAAGVPIAAPSANPFTSLSPTTAEHVRKWMGDQVACILDGGPTNVGIESTVVSLAGGDAVLLRPGAVSQAEIEALIGPVRLAADPVAGSHAAPGMHVRHYSPRTPLLLTSNGKLPATGLGAYLWLTQPGQAAQTVEMPRDAPSYAARLYQTLHRLDDEHLDWIAVENPPDGPEWAAIRDRLRRAAGSERLRH
jgi:L-threonylcarbamoyladenylate synthase